MNGFLLVFGSSLDFGSLDRFSVPGIRREGLLRRTVGNSLTFIGWGAEAGDIHISIGPGSVLILNGYVSETPFLQDVGDQQRVCDELRAHLPQDDLAVAMGKAMQDASGSFSLVYVDATKGDVVIGTDRIAARPMWYKRSGSGCLISSHATAIAQILPRSSFDLGALASLLLYGGQADPSFSLFAGVRAVREGTIMTFSGDREVTTRRWYKFQHRPDRKLSYRGWVDLISCRLKEAAERTLRVSPDPMVFLSGGLDSRLQPQHYVRRAGGHGW